MARHDQHRTDNHPAGARRGLRTGAAALSLAAIAALGLPPRQPPRIRR